MEALAEALVAAIDVAKGCGVACERDGFLREQLGFRLRPLIGPESSPGFGRRWAAVCQTNLLKYRQDRCDPYPVSLDWLTAKLDREGHPKNWSIVPKNWTIVPGYPPAAAQ